MVLRRLLPILFGLTAASAAPEAMAQDPLAVSPKNYHIEIDNSWVRVFRVKQDPHEKTPLVEHPASVTVYLTDVHQRFTGADGKAHSVNHKVGDVAWTSSVKRAEENLSGKPLELILIELKPGAPKPISPPITL